MQVRTSKTTYYYLPEQLDFNSFTLPEKVKKDHLQYIVSTIISRADYKLKYNGYVSLMGRILQSKMRNYKKHLEFLLSNQIIVTDFHYKKTKYAIGYAIHPKYRYNKVKSVQAVNRERNTIKKIQKEKKQRKDIKHLIQSFENIEFNGIGAIKFIDEKLNRKEWNIVQYNKARVCIHKMINREFNCTIDSTAGRFHSPITGMNKELRKFISYKNEKLVSIDIKSCQPYLLTHILNYISVSTSNSLSTLSNNSINNIPFQFNIYNPHHSLSSLLFSYMIQQEDKIGQQIELPEDISLYRKLIKDGTFYDYMQLEAETKLKMKFKNKKTFKPEMFKVLFTSNRFFGQYEARFKKMFAQLFPTVYRMIKIIQKNNKKRLSVILQSIEAEVMLHGVCKELNQQSIPFFTIHDCIMTTESNVRSVTKSIKKFFHILTGIEPILEITCD